MGGPTSASTQIMQLGDIRRNRKATPERRAPKEGMPVQRAFVIRPFGKKRDRAGARLTLIKSALPSLSRH